MQTLQKCHTFQKCLQAMLLQLRILYTESTLQKWFNYSYSARMHEIDQSDSQDLHWYKKEKEK